MTTDYGSEIKNKSINKLLSAKRQKAMFSQMFEGFFWFFLGGGFFMGRG